MQHIISSKSHLHTFASALCKTVKYILFELLVSHFFWIIFLVTVCSVSRGCLFLLSLFEWVIGVEVVEKRGNVLHSFLRRKTSKRFGREVWELYLCCPAEKKQFTASSFP